MQKFAAFVMRGRIQAMLVAALFGILSLLLPIAQPLMTVVSGAVVALVALRLGAREGIFVVVGAALGVSALTLMMLGNPAPGLVFAAVVWLPAWLLALLLRATICLALAFQASALLGGLIVLAVYTALPDPAAWWGKMFETVMLPAMQQAGMGGADQVRQVLGAVLSRMTGILAGAQVLTLLFSLLIARWWQALLYNPGGFGSEFYALHLGNRLAYPALIVLGAGLFVSGSIGDAAKDLLVVLTGVYMLQGLAVAHGVAAAAKANPVWLMTLYTLMAILLPFVAVALAGVGLADNWLNIRSYFGVNRKPPAEG